MSAFCLAWSCGSQHDADGAAKLLHLDVVLALLQQGLQKKCDAEPGFPGPLFGQTGNLAKENILAWGNPHKRKTCQESGAVKFNVYIAHRQGYSSCTGEPSLAPAGRNSAKCSRTSDENAWNCNITLMSAACHTDQKGNVFNLSTRFKLKVLLDVISLW